MKRIRTFIATSIFFCLLWCAAEYYGSYESMRITEFEEIEDEKLAVEITNISTHTGIQEENYYQYTALGNSEKEIYQAIDRAIKNAEIFVDLDDYTCSSTTLEKVYQCVVADHPQYFYLAKSYRYTPHANQQTVNRLILIYTDGTTEDAYDSSGKRTVTANRTLISRQIEAFNNKISLIIKDIPVNVSDIEKEKSIYDYIQKNVVYDEVAASLATSNAYENVPHAYNAFGAACEENAVCEGYAELFQYLCYCVGINATQVCGTASGGAHMWNAVMIGNEWYMVDVTGDDRQDDSLYCYNYFNLTTDEMSVDHSVDSSSLKVPNCTSTTNAFYNHYAFYIESTSEAPINYKDVLDYIVTNDETYLCVYIGNQTEDMQKYISKQLYGRNSEVQKYIRSMNYTIDFEKSYYSIRNYYYIPLK